MAQIVTLWLRDKASAYNVGDPGLIPGSGGFHAEGNGNPLQYSYLENSVGYNPWCRKELDTTERLHFHFSLVAQMVKDLPAVQETWV